MQLLRQKTLLTLKEWLADYRLPPAQEPLHNLEMANLKLLFNFLAALALASQQSHSSAAEALKEFLPDHPALPTSGPPSEALKVLGLGPGRGPVYELQQRWLEEFTPEQGVVLLSLCDG